MHVLQEHQIKSATQGWPYGLEAVVGSLPEESAKNVNAQHSKMLREISKLKAGSESPVAPHERIERVTEEKHRIPNGITINSFITSAKNRKLPLGVALNAYA